MYLISQVLVGLLEVSSAFQFHRAPPSDKLTTPCEVQGSRQSPTSPIAAHESSASRGTPTSLHTAHVSRETNLESRTGYSLSDSKRTETVVLTANMQWTLARVTFTLYTEDMETPVPRHALKMQFDMEDILTTLDIQEVFTKVRCKVVSAHIIHFRKTSPGAQWKFGPYLGMVMRANEELCVEEKNDNGFMSMTFTRAHSKSTQTRWGIPVQRKHRKVSYSQSHPEPLDVSSELHYINEVIVKLQPVDFVLSPQTLSSFTAVFQPLSILPERRRLRSQPNSNTYTIFNSRSLPLLYLDSKALRIFLPCTDLTDAGGVDDVCVVQIESVHLVPQAVNPLGRVIIRPDLYASAERSRTLNVPGSDIEDRQYQFDIIGFSLSTGSWVELDRGLTLPSFGSDSLSQLKTMSENPAVQWNYMAAGQESLTPHISLTPVVARMEVCIIAAPAIIDSRNVLVCGHSLEVNALTDIEVAISTDALLLASTLFGEVLTLFNLLLESTPSKTMLVRRSTSELAYNEQLLNIINMQLSNDSGLNVDAMSASSRTVVRTIQEDVSVQEKSSGYLEEEDSFSSVMPHPSFQRKECLPDRRDQRVRRVVPVELLLTGGSLSLSLYEIFGESNTNLKVVLEHLKDRAEESRSLGRRCVYFLDEDDTRKKSNSVSSNGHDSSTIIQPFVYILLAQPHLYASRLGSERKVQISCFDAAIRSSSRASCYRSEKMPHTKDFPYVLLETKNGDPHRDTGCPPAFVTSKWTRSGLKPAKLSVEIGRPTKFYCSIIRCNFLNEVVSQVLSCFTVNNDYPHIDSSPDVYELKPLQNYSAVTTKKILGQFSEQSDPKLFPDVLNSAATHSLTDKVNDASVKENELNAQKGGKEQKRGYSTYTSDYIVSTQQFVLDIETSSNVKLVLSFASLSGQLHNQGDRDRITGHMSLNCLTLTTINYDVPRLLINPWNCSANLCLAWEPWLPCCSPPRVEITADSECFILEISPEHLYCLYRVWAEYSTFADICEFKSQSVITEPSRMLPNSFVEQEQHYRDDLRAGAFQFVETNGSREDLPLPYQVVFWQDPPMMAWRYPQPRALTRVDVFPVPFKVAIPSKNMDKQQVFCWLQYWSEVQGRFQTYAQFTLSESEVRRLELPGQTVACIWRVQLALYGEDDEDVNSARITINPKTLAACMRVDSFFSPRLVPQIQVALNVSTLQVSLYNYVSGQRPLPTQLEQYLWDGIIPEYQGFLTAQLDNASFHYSSWSDTTQVINLSSHFRLDILDYAYLTEQCVVEPFRSQVTLKLKEILSFSCTSKPISVRVSTAAGHTLTASVQLWMQALREYQRQEKGRNQGKDSEANESDEYQVVVSRYVICNDTSGAIRFGQYSTDEDLLLGSRQCHFYAWRSQKSKPLLRVGIEGAWVWSSPFPIDTDGTRSYILEDCGESSVIIKVASLSGTQKQVTVFGQLRIINLLVEHFECRVLELDDDMKNVHSLVVPGESTPPSMLLNPKKEMALKIRFNNLDTWSGFIPLKENRKSEHPWVIKVPLQERGQFLCIWCHIFNGQSGSILAALYPIYSIRSLLPVPANLTIDTMDLNVQLTTVVKGCGEEEQLYCPGTTDNTHKLTLQLRDSSPAPSVPLGYSMLERRKVQTFGNQLPDIDDVINMLRQPSEPSGWPFAGEDYADIQWIAPPQPHTNIRVHYQHRNAYCATLQVQILPQALILNTVGFSVDVIGDKFSACSIPHQGVLMPPQLEGTFHLAVASTGQSRAKYRSPPLSLHKPGSSFYMPKISGLIPVTGNISISIPCGNTFALFCISSRLVPDEGAMRVVHIKPCYIFRNMTQDNLQVRCLAVQGANKRPVPEVVGQSIVPIPAQDPNGHPLIQWSIVGAGEAELVPYIMVSMGIGWSRPLLANDKFKRRGFSIPTEYSQFSDKPFVLTLQEQDGQTYLSIHPETKPHVRIENKCGFRLFVAEEMVGEHVPVAETPHFDWHCCIEPGTGMHYTLPSLAEGYPDVGISGTKWPKLIFSVASPPLDGHEFNWSSGINISDSGEHFVRLPSYGDVKVHVNIICLTAHITVETVSHVEISAREIRTRLSQQHEEIEKSQYSEEVLYTLFEQEEPPVSKLEALLTADERPSITSEARDNILRSSAYSVSSLTDVAPSLPTSEISVDDFRDGPDSRLGSLNTPSDLSVGVCTSSADLDKSVVICKEDTTDSIFKEISIVCFVHGFNLTLVEDLPELGIERTEIMLLSLVDLGASWDQNVLPDGKSVYELMLCIGSLQLDNQMFQRGGFDFPVLLVGQNSYQSSVDGFSLAMPARKLVEQTLPNSIVKVVSVYEGPSTTLTDVKVAIGPLSVYIEDTLFIKLAGSLLSFLPYNLVLTPEAQQISTSRLGVPVPPSISWRSLDLANPLRLHSLCIESVELLLSVHAYIKVYLALDRSPLTLHLFERKSIETSYYRLGRVFALHYLTDAIFGAGWVVGSMELLGSPGGLCRTVGSGIKDFVYMPIQGILQGPWGFFMGATHGSVSLLRHCAAGAVGSVTGLATSVARNLDCLSLDSEHLQRSEELRRLRPQGIRQGLTQGLSGLGINLLGAVGGIAHHPIQLAMSGNVTPRNVVAGVGVGLVGAIVKPLSGAAELVASAGRGLLQGTGWSMLPEAKTTPIIEHAFTGLNSRLKYCWKLSTGPGILLVAEATYVTQLGHYEAVALVLTKRALFLIDTEDDSLKRILSLSELSGVENSSDPTLLRFTLASSLDTDVDAASRARVVDYVKNSSGHVHDELQIDDVESVISVSPVEPINPIDAPLIFYVNPQARNYFLAILQLAKRQSQGLGFQVL